MKNNFVIGIQCFVKLEILQLVLEKLEQCYGSNKYTLILFVDSSNNLLYNRPDWIEKNNNVINYIKNYTSNKFKTIIKHYEKNNLGPYVWCKKTVDLCLDISDYVIFMEDDVIISKDFLLYHEYMFNNYANYNNIFGIASSLMYWPDSYVFDSTKIDKVNKASWIPSFEFGMTKTVWDKYGKYRQLQPEGDMYFGQQCKDNNMYCMYPLIPRSYRHTFQDNSYSLYYAPEKQEENKVPQLSSNIENLNYHDIS
jgi:hypothetical protein